MFEKYNFIIKMTNNIINCKLVVLGALGVGKTSVISNILDKKFNSDSFPTMTANCETKIVNINDRVIKVFLWDTSGEENFHSITKMFYRISDIVILIYDITNKKSFDEIQNYWIEEVNENIENLKGKYIKIII